MSNYVYAPELDVDFYKIGHKNQYPKGTQVVYSNWTARGSRMEGVNEVVAFGMQAFLKNLKDNFDKNFFGFPKEAVVKRYTRFLKCTLGEESPDVSHLEALHDLGFLPIRVRAVKEGTLVPLRVPMSTVENTQGDEFFWLTNYIETKMSNALWQPSTSATIAYQYRKLLDKYCELTGGDKGFVPFQGHDFSYRGMGGDDAAKSSGAGHLLSFFGTDTCPAIEFLEDFYGANIENELVGTSVYATEHSVMCAGGKEGEYDTFKRLVTEVYPKGIVSVVSDTWNLWSVLTDILPRLKNIILDRDGKLVIRPDSGDPVKILCGINIPDLTNDKYIDTLADCEDYMREILVDGVREETPHGEMGAVSTKAIFKFQDKYYSIKVEIEWSRYDKQYYFIDGTRVLSITETTPTPAQLGVIELLWNVFGGTVNEKGFKVLDPHIGAIYGDSITLARCEAICQALMEKGFASTNIVFGIGSFTYQYNTRDTFYFAMKATDVVINGEEIMIQKDPVTDDGTKKSATGRIVVVNTDDIINQQEEPVNRIVAIDGLTIEEQELYAEIDLLEDVFVDGEFVREETLAEIRARLLSYA